MTRPHIAIAMCGRVFVSKRREKRRWRNDGDSVFNKDAKKRKK